MDTSLRGQGDDTLSRQRSGRLRSELDETGTYPGGVDARAPGRLNLRTLILGWEDHAISYVYMDRYVVRRGLSPSTLSACQLLAAAVMLAVALAVTGASTLHPSAVSVAGVVILGIIGTGIAYVLNYQIITSEGATVASTVTYLLPVIAIVLGVLVLGETSPRWCSQA